MSLRLLTDADFNGRVIRGIARCEPSLDLVRVQDVGLRTAADWQILDWAATNDRIVLTHDRVTTTAFAMKRLDAGLPMPGLFVMRDDPDRIGMMIEAVLLVALCTEMQEWVGCIEFLKM